MKKNASYIKRIIRMLRKIDMNIEEWVHHLIKQIEDKNCNQPNQIQ